MICTMLRILAAPVLALTLGIAPSLVYAESGDDRPQPKQAPSRSEIIMRQMFKGLDLSEEQREGVKKVMLAHRAEVEAFRDANKEKIQALREQMQVAGQKQDREALEKLRQQVQAIASEAPKSTDVVREIMPLLDDAQKTQFASNMQGLQKMIEQQRIRQRGHPVVHAMFKDLSLSAEQREVVQKVMQTHHQKAEAFRKNNAEKLQAIQQRMRAAHESENEEALTQARGELEVVLQAGPKLTDVADDIRALLEEKQVSQFNANLEVVRAMLKQHHRQGRG